MIGNGSGLTSRLFKYFYYNRDLDMLVAEKPITTTLNSFYLGQQHKMSSAAENMVFTNITSKVNYFPSWSGLKDHSDPLNRDSSGVFEMSARKHSLDMLELEPFGDPGIEDKAYDVMTTLSVNTCLFGVAFVLGQDVYKGDVLEYQIMNPIHKVIYQQTMKIQNDLLEGEYLEFWFDHPSWAFKGDTFHITNTVNKNPLLVKKSSSQDHIYIKFFMRTFEDQPIITKDVFESTPSGSALFVTNITSSGNVVLNYDEQPNEKSVIGVNLENTDARVYLEWDRGGEYQGLPTVNDTPVTVTNKQGSTYTGFADIINVTDKISCIYGSIVLELLNTALEKPTATGILTNNFPTNQTELKNNDISQVIVNANEPIDRLQVLDTVNNIGQPETIIVDGVNPVVDFKVNCLNTVVEEKSLIFRVRNLQGTWSDSITTSNTKPTNNTYPSISFIGVTYPFSRGALKNTETATINKNMWNQDTVEINLSPELELIDENTVRRVSGDYLLAYYNIALTRLANGAVTNANQPIRIANVPAQLIDNAPVKVRSGVGPVELPCFYTQDLESTPNNPTITAIDTDVHSDTILYSTFFVTNLAGIQTQIDRAYIIKGFAQKVFNLLYPNSTQNIGTNITDIDNLIVSGQINTSPPYIICENRVSTLAELNLVSEYLIENMNTITMNQQALSDFGYSSENSITVRVEEI